MRHSLFLSILVVLLLPNAIHAQYTIPSKPEIDNLIEPVRLNIDTTVLYLADYMVEPSRIDSITFPTGLRARWDKSSQTVTMIAQQGLAPLSDMQLWSKRTAYSVLLKKSEKKYITFTYDPKGKRYKTVQLSGEMNDWTPKRNSFTNVSGVWKAEVALNPGIYQYQLVIDGKWMLDPANADSVSNGNGGYNSVYKASRNENQPKVEVKLGEKNSLTLTYKKPLSLICYWQNHKLDTRYLHRIGDDLQLEIPPAALEVIRSHIRIWVMDNNNAYQDYLIPLDKGKPILSPKLLERSDKHTNRMYFVLVDRFADGDKRNNIKTIFPANLKDKANYYGGDLAGIQHKINEGYFDAMHVNSLWISPIVKNPFNAFKEYPEPHDWYSGYHGYWPVSLTRIDYRMGSDEVLAALTTAAHGHHINVLLDLVANHVHEEYPLIKQHPEWRTQLNLPDGRKNIRLWDECRLTTWFDSFLPTLDFTQPAVVSLEVDSSVYWIKRFDLDGFRHDATKHIPEVFWRALTLKLKKEIELPDHKSLYQIGETYGSKELIGSYINSGMLDGQFDFNLYFDAREAFAKDGITFTKVASTLRQSISYYGSHHLMGNITGNHDLPRFASLAGGGLSFTEDARKAGWERSITIGSDDAYPKMAMLAAFISTIPGVPVIYYGDEIAMPGAGDPDNRRMMRFDNLTAKEQKLKQTVAALYALRSNNMALQYGQAEVTADNETMTITRTYLDNKAIAVFNKSKKPQRVSLPHTSSKPKAMYGTRIQKGQTPSEPLFVILPPLSFDIFTTK
jgi:cyclomaltodextrinase / maltogenic alpha-amylase / neopullulanase